MILSLEFTLRQSVRHAQRQPPDSQSANAGPSQMPPFVAFTDTVCMVKLHMTLVSIQWYSFLARVYA